MQPPLFGARSGESFAAEFARVIAPELARLDSERKRYLKAAAIIWTIAGTISAILVAVLWWRSADWVLLIVLGGVPLALGWQAATFPVRFYRDAVRAIVMAPVCRFIGNLEYVREPLSGIDPAPLEAVGLLPGHNRVAQEDELRGSYRNTTFRMVEMTLETVRRSGRRRRTTTVFHGLVMALELPGPASGRVLIGREPGLLGKPFANQHAALRGLALVEFDDRAFEDAFRVYSDAPHEAHRLLNPLMRAALLALVADRQRAGLKAAFVDGHFYCAFAIGSLVEPGSLLRPSSTLTDDVQRLLREVTLPHRVLDHLHGSRAAAP